MLTTFQSATTFLRPVVRRSAIRALATQAPQQAAKQGSQQAHENGSWIGAAAFMGLGVVTAGTVTFLDARQPHYPQPKTMVPADTPTAVTKAPQVNTPSPRPDLPTFSREEVAEHCDEDSLWYTFRGGVYDLTAFYQGHPGGAPVSLPFQHLMALVTYLLLYRILIVSTYLRTTFIPASSHGGRPRLGTVLGGIQTAPTRPCSRLDGKVSSRQPIS